ncbi:MAG: type II toxin-antitoxin system RelE/ParE family toxin [Armatimonadetes bacterium]|nr:type II toxin-antitoxin system RelE/ParE family toxin [Armatimonadota bacterium]
MLLRPTLPGRCYTILVVEDNRGHCQVEEFIEDLSKQNRAEYKKLMARMERLAQHGDPRNEQLFRHLWDELWEIKTTKVRIICWRAERILVLLEAFMKRTDHIPPQVQKRVDEIAQVLPWLLSTHERGA